MDVSVCDVIVCDVTVRVFVCRLKVGGLGGLGWVGLGGIVKCNDFCRPLPESPQPGLMVSVDMLRPLVHVESLVNPRCLEDRIP